MRMPQTRARGSRCMTCGSFTRRGSSTMRSMRRHERPFLELMHLVRPPLQRARRDQLPQQPPFPAARGRQRHRCRQMGQMHLRVRTPGMHQSPRRGTRAGNSVPNSGLPVGDGMIESRQVRRLLSIHDPCAESYWRSFPVGTAAQFTEDGARIERLQSTDDRLSSCRPRQWSSTPG